MPPRLLSLAIALGATVVGWPILWFAAGSALKAFDVSGVEPFAAFPATLLGISGGAVLACAGYSIRFSSLGALVAGGLNLVAAAVALTVVSQAGPEHAVRVAVFPDGFADNPLGAGLAISLIFGVAAIMGIIWVLSGLAALRTRPASLLWRWLGAVVGVIATFLIFWVLAVGMRLYVEALVAQNPDMDAVRTQAGELGLLLLLFALGGLTLIRSAAAAWVAGVLTLGAGLVLVAPLTEILGALPPVTAYLLVSIGPTGILAAIGLSMWGAGFGLRVRRTAAQPQDDVG